MFLAQSKSGRRKVNYANEPNAFGCFDLHGKAGNHLGKLERGRPYGKG